MIVVVQKCPLRENRATTSHLCMRNDKKFYNKTRRIPGAVLKSDYTYFVTAKLVGERGQRYTCRE